MHFILFSEARLCRGQWKGEGCTDAGRNVADAHESQGKGTQRFLIRRLSRIPIFSW